MTPGAVLRAVAVLIAVLGAIDPAITLARRVREPLVLALNSTQPAALTSAARVRELLQGEYDIRLRNVSEAAGVPVCSAGESCVLIGDDRWPSDVVDVAARLVGAVRVPARTDAHVTIASVAVPAASYASAVGRLMVEATALGVAGQTSTIDVFDGDVPVGRVVHTWAGDGPVTLPVEWWPLAAGVRQLSVRASRGDSRDDQTNVGVEVRTTPYNVLVYDTRPTWTSTFVRRAIERDPRLALRVVARLGPRLQVTGGEPFRLDETTLTEASAVIVGAPEELSAQDVNLLERFVRVRGGSLILVPDRRPTGPIARLLPSPMTERLEPAPVPVGAWRASELLVFPRARAELAILASVRGEAVVLAAPSGNGRILVSGAMDAWRYRDADANAFDGAWRSLIPDVAMAGGRVLEVFLNRSVVQPAEEVHATVLARAMAPLDATVGVSATLACAGEQPRDVRLWPSGDRRRFQARFVPAAPGTCQLTVSSSAPVVATDTASLVVSEDFRDQAPAQPSSPKPQAFEGARLVEAGDEMTLARDVQRVMPATMAPTDVRAMRSPWWIVPFAACLGVEWWLRRRRGLR